MGLRARLNYAGHHKSPIRQSVWHDPEASKKGVRWPQLFQAPEIIVEVKSGNINDCRDVEKRQQFRKTDSLLFLLSRRYLAK